MIAKVQSAAGESILGDNMRWTGARAAELNADPDAGPSSNHPAFGFPGPFQAQAAADLLGGKVTYLRPIPAADPAKVY